VRGPITHAYQGIQQCFYLETGQLQEVKLQSLDGNTACSRRGCLCILDKEVGAFVFERTSNGMMEDDVVIVM